MDFVRRWSEKTEIGAGQFIAWLGVTFLIANWLQVRWGKGSEAVLLTFGLGFLIMALYEVIRHGFTSEMSDRKVHP